jgi:hypothetical protein
LTVAQITAALELKPPPDDGRVRVKGVAAAKRVAAAMKERRERWIETMLRASHE